MIVKMTWITMKRRRTMIDDENGGDGDAMMKET